MQTNYAADGVQCACQLIDVESVHVRPVREDGDTEESGASSIEDGREESDEETAPEAINKLKNDEVAVKKSHLLNLMKGNQVMQRQSALGQEVVDFPADPVVSVSSYHTI